MKLLVNGKVVEGTIDAKFADLPVGHPCLRLPNDVVVEPRFAMLHDYRIVKATKAERASLRRAGYDLVEAEPEANAEVNRPRQARDTDHS
jgi:hypothetical protein